MLIDRHYGELSASTPTSIQPGSGYWGEIQLAIHLIQEEFRGGGFVR